MSAFTFNDPQKLESAFRRFLRSLPPPMRPANGSLPTFRSAFAQAHGARNWEDGLALSKSRQRQAGATASAAATQRAARGSQVDLTAPLASNGRGRGFTLPYLDKPLPKHPTEQQQIDEYANTLVTLIVAMNEHRERTRFGRRSVEGPPTMFTSSLERNLKFLDAVEDPIESALHLQIRAIGQRLHELEDPSAMQSALILARDQANELGISNPYPDTVIDRAWHGIGPWLA